jgi:uncharacterized membrane protein YhiD involved in acid resistance
MFELFPDHPVYEYSDLVNISYVLVWAFLLSALIGITHRLTFTGEHYPKNFFQALMLGAVVTAMVMMAVGDSLARGLGVFGAMAIIRFRTRIDDPRNVLFLFAALSSGLAVGVYGYTISFVGTIIFCLVAFILHISPFKSYSLSSLIYFTLRSADELPKVMALIEKSCGDHRLISISLNKEKAIRYQYSIAMKKNITKDHLINELKTIEGITQLRVTINESMVNDY